MAKKPSKALDPRRAEQRRAYRLRVLLILDLRGAEVLPRDHIAGLLLHGRR